MEDKSNIEILHELAESTNRKIFTQEFPYPVAGIGTFQKYRRTAYMPYNSKSSNYFVWFSDQYAKIGIPTVFCGAFIPISSKIESKLNIRKKYFFDKINFLSKSRKNRTGYSFFDSKVIIKGEINPEIKKLLMHTKLQMELLKALDIDDVLNISINEFDLDFIPDFKGKSYLSIINPQSWWLEKNEIEKLFNQMELMREILN